MVFNFLNGSQMIAGNIKSFSITTNYTVNLVNKYLSGLYIRSGTIIDSIQFETTDWKTGVVTLGIHCGGYGGSATNTSLYFKII